MNKKVLIFGGYLALALGVGAQELPTAVWGNLIDGSTAAGDQSTDISIDRDGNVYWFGSYGSTEDASVINYAGQPLYEGVRYNAGNSQNNNYTLLKTDNNGQKLWCVYSGSGDFALNAGFSSPTSDGGIITVSKVRHTDGMTDRNISFVDADGNPVEVEWTCDRRFYKLAVTKISSEGRIEWNRMIDFSTVAGPKASGNYADFWPDVFNLSGGTVDDDDNIYIALNYRNPITVQCKDGDPVIITPANTSLWNGDPQSVCGDFLILGLDNEGYYRNKFELKGECSASYCQKLAWADGALFAQGYIIGKENQEIKAGEHTLSPSTIISPLILSVNKEMKINWVKCFRGEAVAGKSALQNVGINYIDSHLYMCGQYNLSFCDPDNSEYSLSSSQGAVREGFILKLRGSDGAWIASRNSRDDDWCNPSAVAKTGLTGYQAVIPDALNPSKIYAFGYVMNASVGVFLRRYDATTLEGDLDGGELNIVTNGGVPSSQCCAYDDASSSLYLTARGNKAFTLYNGESTDAPAGWGILAARINMPHSDQTDINQIIEDDTSPVEYFNLQGIRIEHPTNGLYIRRQGNRIDKVIL